MPSHEQLARPGRLAGCPIPCSTFRGSCGARAQQRPSAFELLRRHDFRQLYLAVSISEIGDALSYIALMWFALDSAGRSASLRCGWPTACPAFVFGLHGGIAADRWSRRKLMVGADLVRGRRWCPSRWLGLSGSLPLWGLVVAAFVLEGATSYFAPAYGAAVPAVVDRTNVQRANALVQATAQALSIGGWALAAVLLAILPVSTFFAVDAATFFLSAALIVRLHPGRGRARLGRAAAAARGHRRAPAATRPGGSRSSCSGSR